MISGPLHQMPICSSQSWKLVLKCFPPLFIVLQIRSASLAFCPSIIASYSKWDSISIMRVQPAPSPLPMPRGFLTDTEGWEPLSLYLLPMYAQLRMQNCWHSKGKLMKNCFLTLHHTTSPRHTYKTYFIWLPWGQLCVIKYIQALGCSSFKTIDISLVV